jgi:hypothetical protein
MQRYFPIGYPKRVVLTDNEVGTSPVTGPTADCVIKAIRISNTSGGAVTFDLVDKASTPNLWFEAVSFGANSFNSEQFSEGSELFCAGGFDYNANSAGLDLQIVYYLKP